MADLTTTGLIDKLKKRGMIPTSQQTFQNSDFLNFLDDELKHYIVPLVMSTREEYFVKITDETIGSTTSFDVPERAIGGKLRDLKRVSSNNVYSIPRINSDDIQRFNDISLVENGFYLESNLIKLLGSFNTADELRISFFRRPNTLVLQSSCALVTSISGNDVTCSSMPTTWDTDDLFDVIRGKSQFSSRGDDQSVTALDTSAKTLSFTSAPSGIVAGDWICLAKESPIPQIPYECFPLLVLKTAAVVTRSIGDDKGAKAKEEKCTEMRDSILGLLSERVEGEPQKIVNNHNLAWRNSRYWR